MECHKGLVHAAHLFGEKLNISTIVEAGDIFFSLLQPAVIDH